ncbi:MAG: AAA family ATPase [Elusimicrobiota bacterium]|nr:AAA family ATPase [Elusimicrobiota bacterium]
MPLSPAQTEKALELLEKFRSGGFTLAYQGTTYNDYKDWDRAREDALKDMHPELDKFLEGSANLREFRDISNKMAFGHNLWGFTSFSGQMVVNGISKYSRDDAETAAFLRKCLALPKSKAEAASKIKEMAEGIPRFLTQGGFRVGSVPYLLSYFWQIQDPRFAPIYYHNSRQTLESLGLYREADDLAQAFIEFWDIHDELANIYKTAFDSKTENKYWYVEHVLWAYGKSRAESAEEEEEESESELAVVGEDDLKGEELALVGTWKDIDERLDAIRGHIKKNKFWPSVWSFRIKETALPELRKPFFVYINVGGGKLKYRMRVVDFVTGLEGSKCPWPDLLDSGHRGRSGVRDGGFSFRTWFKVSEIEELDPPVDPSLARLATRWTKSHKAFLNQSTFGYFYPHAPGAPMMISSGSAYSLEDAAQELFLPRPRLAEIIDLLNSKKNVILQGPPGVGKSFMAKKIAYALIGEDDDSRVDCVQFHQSYGYEDFVQGYRPAKDGDGFRLTRGAFYRFCDEARARPDKRHVLIIDEINRGNLSRILGELMLLIEADKRGPKWRISLAQDDGGQQEFFVPDNVFILGMMNTADRSLAMVDYALRRRFAFVDIPPGFDDAKFERLLLDRGASRNLVAKIRASIEDLNKRIVEDRDLGAGYRVGHSYFCPASGVEKLDDQWYARVIQREIAPLLREYWFEKTQAEVDGIVEKLLK